MTIKIKTSSGLFILLPNDIINGMKGSVAEWSKALVLGTSPKGRGFESHHCQNFVPNKILFGDTGDRTRDISHAKRALYH